MIIKEGLKPLRFPLIPGTVKVRYISDDIITTTDYVKRFTCETIEEGLLSIKILRLQALQNGVSNECN